MFFFRIRSDRIQGAIKNLKIRKKILNKIISLEDRDTDYEPNEEENEEINTEDSLLQLDTIPLKEPKDFQCSHCPCSFKYLSSLKRHRLTKHQSLIQEDNRTNSEENANDEANTNEGEISEHDGKWSKCPACPAYFNLIINLKRHFTRTHPEEENFDNSQLNCEDAKTISKIIKLNKLDSNVKKFFKCPYCPSIFKRNPDLRRHMIYSHPNKTTNEKEPKKPSRNWLELKQEPDNEAEIIESFPIAENIQTDKLWLKCPGCSGYFKNFKNLKIHFSHTHPEMEEQLDYSNLKKRFVNPDAEIPDGKSSVNTKLKKIFKCPSCPTVFKRNPDMRRHILYKHPKSAYELARKVKENIEKNNIKEKDVENKSYIDESLEKQSVSKSKNGVIEITTTDLKDKSVKKYFKCPYCPAFFTYSTEVKTHISIKHRLKVSKRGQVDTDSPKVVIINEKTRKNWFFCIHCPSIFQTYGNLKRHMLMTHGKSPKVVAKSCPTCDMKFSSEWAFKKHVDKHEKDKCVDRPYSCSICERTFTNNGLRIKCEKAHLGKKDLECLNCQEIFKSKLELKKHCAQVHGEGLVRINKNCPVCGKKFVYAHAYKSHVDYHKYYCKDEVSVCTKCVPQKTFTNVRVFYNHMRSHTGFQCNLCGKLYHTSTSLKCHRLRDHGGQATYKCETCSKLFYIKQKLTKHERQVHKIDYSERKELEFQSMLRKLNREEMVKTDHDFICDLCGEGFSDTSKLLIHKRFHEDEKTFDCQFCDRVFLVEAGLKHHVTLDHSEPKFYVLKTDDMDIDDLKIEFV